MIIWSVSTNLSQFKNKETPNFCRYICNFILKTKWYQPIAPILKKKLPWLWSFCVVFLLHLVFCTGCCACTTAPLSTSTLLTWVAIGADGGGAGGGGAPAPSCCCGPCEEWRWSAAWTLSDNSVTGTGTTSSASTTPSLLRRYVVLWANGRTTDVNESKIRRNKKKVCRRGCESWCVIILFG